MSALTTDADGRVTGIEIGEDRASCGALVLATGGFGANDELIECYYPTAAAAGDWRWYIGTDGAQGDGLRLGETAGGVIDGHDRGLLLTTPGFSHDLEVLLPGWLILVNAEGRRFCNECAPYTVMAGLLQHQGGHAWAVFDETARAAAKPGPMSQAYWVHDVLARKADEGRILRASTLAQLAARMNVDADGLAGTVTRYNADAERGQDSAFFKPPPHAAISSPPFYGVEIRPAIVCWTGAGLRIDADTCVLNRHERPIPGLYAAGETVGNLHGDRYVGGGGLLRPLHRVRQGGGRAGGAPRAGAEPLEPPTNPAPGSTADIPHVTGAVGVRHWQAVVFCIRGCTRGSRGV